MIRQTVVRRRALDRPVAAVRSRLLARTSASLSHSVLRPVFHQLPPMMSTFGPAEHVYVENEWYDGPRAGIADVNGMPHRFTSEWDEVGDEYLGTYLVWPVSAEELALEQEQWAIFVAWNDRFEAGTADTNSHPGHVGTNARWDEIEAQLASKRKSTPPAGKRAKVQFFPLEGGSRYALSGPAYQLSWALI